MNNWKVSSEGRTFLKDASLQASEIGHAEALRKVRAVIEKVAPGLSWAKVEEGVGSLSQEDAGASETPKVEDQALGPSNLEG